LPSSGAQRDSRDRRLAKDLAEPPSLMGWTGAAFEKETKFSRDPVSARVNLRFSKQKSRRGRTPCIRPRRLTLRRAPRRPGCPSASHPTSSAIVLL